MCDVNVYMCDVNVYMCDVNVYMCDVNVYMCDVLSQVMQEFEQRYGSGCKVHDIRGAARKVCNRFLFLAFLKEDLYFS